jgi:hypothetical protein
MKNKPHQTDSIMTDRERCMAYLLGEMDECQTAAFESELGDRSLSAALSRESDFLFCVATNESLDSGRNPVSTPALPCPSARPTTRSIVALIASLAATILFVSFYSFPRPIKTTSQTAQAGNDPSPASFELQLAMAWVDPAIDWTSDDQDDFFATAPEIGLGSIDETDSEESFEWMVAAVRSSIGEGENDVNH